MKDLQGQVARLKQAMADKEAEHQAQLDGLAFDHMLGEAIAAARGRSGKAIRALLEVDTLKASRNQAADIKAALEELKKNSGYLFEQEEAPPPYAPGTGTGGRAAAGLDAIRAAAGLHSRLFDFFTCSKLNAQVSKPGFRCRKPTIF